MSYPIDLQLKTDSYQTFLEECEKAGLVTEEGEILTSSHNHSLVLLGVLRKPTGETLTDEEGDEYPETVALSGYHANLRAKEPTGIEHLAVECDTPLVKFA